MDFSDYPLDEHTCYFRIQDFNYPDDTVTYYLYNYEVENITLNQASVKDYTIDIIPGLPDSMKIANDGWPIYHSVIGFQIKLRRNMEKYIITHYISSALLVVLSWVSDFLNGKNFM